MATVENVKLEFERPLVSLGVTVKVRFQIRFTPKEIEDRQKFRVAIELLGTDVGEDHHDLIGEISPLYQFRFGRYGSRYMTVTASREVYEPSEPLVAVVLPDVLDEDPGTVPGFRDARLPNGDTIRVPARLNQADEVVAVVRVTPASVTTARSQKVTVPRSGVNEEVPE